jgi:hypothetical protein
MIESLCAAVETRFSDKQAVGMILADLREGSSAHASYNRDETPHQRLIHNVHHWQHGRDQRLKNEAVADD